MSFVKNSSIARGWNNTGAWLVYICKFYFIKYLNGLNVYRYKIYMTIVKQTAEKSIENKYNIALFLII